ncbi:hypothetical protein FOMPIDRAFT_151870 [Fomitopsis schrenkii]|uniref:Uncharacterized protein n=1 Tax=Fomitopsis schrenkii TaxID=2126942 RepID=S8DKK8_FOMSC|nr:hypothetical protein FOMPIDRAFT_151870 [Fomitopsis schrenkii]
MSMLFAIYRYFAFAFFTACNIAICVIAAKIIYIALILKNGSILEIDALLIALGGVGLLFTFPILLIDALRKKSVSRHVWFECLWVGIFCLLQSAGAGVATATMSSFQCLESVSAHGVPTYGTCVESTLILAFTWAAAGNFIIYFLTLLIASLVHQRHNPRVWKAYTSEFPWSSSRRGQSRVPLTPLVLVQAVLNSGRLRCGANSEQPMPSLRLHRSSNPRPSVEKPRWAFSPTHLTPSSAVSPRITTTTRMRRSELPVGATTARTRVSAKRPREPQKRVLRLHRPPSLDLSKISRTW